MEVLILPKERKQGVESYAPADTGTASTSPKVMKISKVKAMPKLPSRLAAVKGKRKA